MEWMNGRVITAAAVCACACAAVVLRRMKDAGHETGVVDEGVRSLSNTAKYSFKRAKRETLQLHGAVLARGACTARRVTFQPCRAAICCTHPRRMALWVPVWKQGLIWARWTAVPLP